MVAAMLSPRDKAGAVLPPPEILDARPAVVDRFFFAAMVTYRCLFIVRPACRRRLSGQTIQHSRRLLTIQHRVAL